MKIIQICSGIGDLHGGAELFCLELSRQLSCANYDVQVLTGASVTNTDHKYPFPIKILPDQPKKFLRKIYYDYYNRSSATAFNDIITIVRPQIVHFHSFYGLPSSLALIASETIPTVITLHDTWSTFYDGAMITPKFEVANAYWKLPLGLVHRSLNRRFFSRSTLVSPSAWLKEFFCSRGIFTPPIHIPNAIDISENITRYDDELLWVGQLSPHKGLQTVIDTLYRVSSAAGWRVTIAGEGQLRDTLERNYPSINFVGYVDPQMYYQRASILIVSSICFENLPTVILEGMANGVCVIGRNIGGISELIQHGENGLTYESENDLETLLWRLITNKEQMREYGLKGRQFVNRNYSWSACIDNYRDLYKDLLKSGPC